MLQINPLFTNIKNIYKPKQQINKQQFQASPLRPLAHDCICFTSSKKLNRGLLDAFDNKETCIEIYKNADVAEADLKKTLKNSLGKFVNSEENPTGPIASITTRIKSPNSIREKVASELSHALTSDLSLVFNPNKKSDVKKICKDIIGARITLGREEETQTKKIIDTLIENIKNGELDIESIANFIPSEETSKLEYFSQKDIKRLVDAVNESRALRGKAPIKLRQETKKTGYMALHIDVNLSDSEYKAKNTGYYGEIQIVGQDVCRLKEVEDFCYKLRFDKDIKNGHVAYSPFTSHFTKHIKDGNYPNLSDDFVEYTKRAYLYQRKKEPEDLYNKKKKKDLSLPTIEQCGMTGLIPPHLDFNILSKIKYHCDKIYELTSDEPI